MDQQLGVPSDFAKEWDQVESGWWYRVTGRFEVHLSHDRDLGWEVGVRECGEMKTKPVFRKELSVAINVAERLFDHYDAIVVAERDSAVEVA